MDNYQNNQCDPNGNNRHIPYGDNPQGPPPYNNYNYANQNGHAGNCSSGWYNNDSFAEGPSGKSRGVTALLAIFLGTLGIQYFYLGKTTAGVITLLISVLSCGILATIISVMTLIQGILLFCMSNEEFERKFAGPTSSSFPMF